MHYRVLGPLELTSRAGQPVELGSAKLRALLTLLLVDAGRVVPLDRIVDELWGDRPPPSATGTVQSYVSHLRRLLEPDRGPGRPAEVLLTRAPGYVVVADADALDLLQLPSLVDQAAALLPQAPADAEPLLATAVGLWRGDPLPDLSDGARTSAERARLVELHLRARELRAACWTALGRADAAVAELEGLVAEQPLRERLWARLVEALYAAGRQADALEACRACATVLRDELGLDPGPELRQLEQAVLRQDASLAVRVPVQRAAPDDAAPPSDERPLVGRRGERARLRAVLGEVARGHGGVVVLEGAAGIGKTRLAEEGAALAGASGWRVAWSRCADDAGAPALWPWLQVLDRLEAGPLAAPTSDDPDRSRFSLFQDLRGRLQAVASAVPLLVVLDDVQAADATSLQLLSLLARHLDGVRLLVVVTVRTVGEDLPVAVVECLAGLAREPHVQRVRLEGLDEGDVRELVAGRLGGPVAGSGTQDTLAHEVHARTAGNPFFVVELVELMRSEQRLDAVAAALPPSVRDVLDRRLARLPQDTIDLLRLAAVAGRDADLGLLQSAAQLDAEQVITRLEPAVVAGVVDEDDVAWSWRFSHALVQETLVAGLSRIGAARLHARVAQALQAGADAERLAHHCFHAVPITGPGPARHWLEAAAAAARTRLAHTEAAAHTRRALSLLGPGGDAAERHDLLVGLADDLLHSGDLQQAQDVVREALTVARQLGDPDRLAEAASVWGGVTLWNWRAYGVVDEELVRLLLELVDRAGDGDPALRARLLGTLGVELAYSPRRDEGAVYATRAVEIARELGDPAVLGRALNNFSLAAWGAADRVERRLAAADEALALAGRGLPARTEFFARLHRGPLRLHLGDVTGFTDDLGAATRLAAGLTGPDVRPHLLYQEAGLHMLHGAWAEAEALAEQVYALYRDASMWGAQCCWALHQFTFRRRQGRLAEVIGLLVDTGDHGVPIVQAAAVLAAVEVGDREEARRLRRRWSLRIPEDWTTDALITLHARLALALDGDVEAAYARLLPYAGRQVVVGTATACWGSYDALLGELALARGDRLRAAAHLREADRLGREVGSPWQTGHVAPGLARATS